MPVLRWQQREEQVHLGPEHRRITTLVVGHRGAADVPVRAGRAGWRRPAGPARRHSRRRRSAAAACPGEQRRDQLGLDLEGAGQCLFSVAGLVGLQQELAQVARIAGAGCSALAALQALTGGLKGWPEAALRLCACFTNA